MLEPAWLDVAKDCIEKNHAEYYDIVPLTGQIKTH